MRPSKNLVFFGNERLSTSFSPKGAPTLQALIDAGYHISAVVANYEAGTTRKARELEIQAVAKAYNIPFLLPTKLSTITDQLRAYHPAVGVLVAYGKIIPQSIIDLFPNGILNIHPSLLPRYRGSTPIESAILDGASETGVSIMKLVKAMDAGPVFAQAKVSLTSKETKKALTGQLLNLGGKLLLQTLPQVLAKTIQPTDQDETMATYTSQIQKTDAVLDTQKTAPQLEREIRAFAGWPKSRTQIFGKDIIVTRARVARNDSDGELTLSCGSQTWLEILELIAPSGRTMSGAAFLRGYKK